MAARILESYLVLFLALAIVGSLPNTPKRLAMGIYIAIIVLTESQLVSSLVGFGECGRKGEMNEKVQDRSELQHP